MSLVDLGSLVFIVGVVLAAAITGGFGRASAVVVDKVVLPAGVTGSFIGVVAMLHNLDDPRAIWPAVSVALLTALYASIIKFGLTLYLGDGEREAQPRGKGVLGALVWLALVVAAAFMGGSPHGFVNFPALLLVGLGVVAIAAGARASGWPACADRIARFLPGLGLLILFGSFVAILPTLDNPKSLGPVMAGLLGHLYATVLAVTVNLLHPERVSAPREASPWLFWAASLAGLGGLIGAVSSALS